MQHQIACTKGKDYPYTCRLCDQIWSKSPSSSCPGVPFYSWRRAPEHLQTYSQLRTKHLKPLNRKKPDGCLLLHQEWLYLYDEREALPRRKCSDRQREVLGQARQRQQEKWKCQHCGEMPSSLAAIKYYFVAPGLCSGCQERLAWEAEQDEEDEMRRVDSNEAIEWARGILARRDWVVLDTETTSLDGVAVEIAIVDPDGIILFDSLINPEMRVLPGARAVHGISDEELATAPTLPEAWDDLQKALAGCSLILTYNAEFDQSIIGRHIAQYQQLPALQQEWSCIMQKYAQYYGEWSKYWGNYKWQPLYGGHRAKDDALAALDLLKRMANTNPDKGEEE
jgi:DNA polymerase III subunit epsilon